MKGKMIGFIQGITLQAQYKLKNKSEKTFPCRWQVLLVI